MNRVPHFSRVLCARSGDFRLPHVASVLRHHRLPRLAAPRLLELRHVLHHAVHAILPRRMRIGADLHPQIFRPLLLAPHPPESQEEALLRREAVDALPFLSRSYLPRSAAPVPPVRCAPRRCPPYFRPASSRPFSFMLSTATKFEYSSATQLTRFSNSFPSCSVHQSRRFPVGSNLRP